MTTNTNSTASNDNDATNDAEDGPDTDVVDALTDVATPLETTDPDAPLDDLDAFGDSIADARIVGLGEATHGTREFFEAKARLIRYCVAKLGTRTIGFEANVGECLAIDEYVVHGEGDPREALEGIYFWTWNVEAVRDLLEWLRAFNAGRPLEDRVRFYGFDAQYTQGPVDRLLTYLDEVAPDFVESVREDLETVADDGTPTQQNENVGEQRAAADRVLPRVRERLDDRRDPYVEDAGERAWAFADRHLETIERALDYQGTVSNEDDEEMLRIRETAMADGVDWLLDRTEEEPLVCWAHDAHVAAADQYVGGVSSRSMGGRLADRHGDDYRALGFTFGRGEFRAIGAIDVEDEEDEEDEDADGETAYDLRPWQFDGPLADTVDAALDATAMDLALVGCREAATDDRLVEWLGTEQPHHSIGATYDADTPEEYTKPYAPGEAFDLLLHVAETTASRPVEE